MTLMSDVGNYLQYGYATDHLQHLENQRAPTAARASRPRHHEDHEVRSFLRSRLRDFDGFFAFFK